jgi:hypothetical protein
MYVCVWCMLCMYVLCILCMYYVCYVCMYVCMYVMYLRYVCMLCMYVFYVCIMYVMYVCVWCMLCMYVFMYLNYALVKQFTDFCLRLKQEKWSLSEALHVGVCVGVAPLIRNWTLYGSEWWALRYCLFLFLYIFSMYVLIDICKTQKIEVCCRHVLTFSSVSVIQ